MKSIITAIGKVGLTIAHRGPGSNNQQYVISDACPESVELIALLLFLSMGLALIGCGYIGRT